MLRREAALESSLFTPSTYLGLPIRELSREELVGALARVFREEYETRKARAARAYP